MGTRIKKKERENKYISTHPDRFKKDRSLKKTSEETK